MVPPGTSHRTGHTGSLAPAPFHAAPEDPLRQLFGSFGVAVELALPVIAAVGLATLVLVVRRRGPGGRRLRTLGGGILAAAVVLVAATTLLPVGGGAPASVNTDPGATISNYLRVGDDLLSARNLGLNIALFVPVGLGLALWRRWGIGRVVPVAVLASTLVETVQYLFPLGRAADVDDVILNTLGAALGAVTVSVVRALAGPPRPPRDDTDAWAARRLSTEG